MKKWFVFLIALMLTGCAGKDPEKRKYALELYICGSGDVAVSTAKLSKSGDETKESVFYNGRGRNIAEAVQNARNKTGGALYFGHLTLCVFDKKAINTDILNEVTELFKHDEELGGYVWVMAADDIKKTEAAVRSGTDITEFAESFYGKNGEYAKNGKAADINMLMYKQAAGEAAEIPLIKCVGEKLEMDGSVTVK